MFIGASGPVQPDFFLLTLGHTCRYAVVTQGAIDLFDVGTSFHIEALIERLKSFGLSPSRIRYVFLSHLHADRIGGVEALRAFAPAMQVMGSSRMREDLSNQLVTKRLAEEEAQLVSAFGGSLRTEEWSAPTINRVIVEGESVTLSPDVSVRSIPLAGHTSHSFGYLVLPYNFLIVDESLGYYQGARAPALGGDTSIEANIQWITKALEIEIHGLCLPDSGMLTGALIHRHMRKILSSYSSIAKEILAHAKDGMSPEEIQQRIKDDYFLSDSSDPIVRHNVESSFAAIIPQLTNSR